MQVSCPECGTRNTRVSVRRKPIEGLKWLCGIYQMRCRLCYHRWQASAWYSSEHWKYATCPMCFRQDLTTWNRKFSDPSTWMSLKIELFGAKAMRCAACRCNFASFRPLREKFVWRYATRVGLSEDSTPNTAEATDQGDLLALARAVSTPKPPAPVSAPSEDFDDEPDAQLESVPRSPRPSLRIRLRFSGKWSGGDIGTQYHPFRRATQT